MTTETVDDTDAETDGAVKKAGHFLNLVFQRLMPLIFLSLIGGALWAVFHWVITDPNLALDYVKAVAWPVVVAAAIYGLRAPIREKFQELLKLEALGVSADFERRSAEKLTSELGPDLDAVSGVRRRRDEGLDVDEESEGESEEEESEGLESEGLESEGLEDDDRGTDPQESSESSSPAVTPPMSPAGHVSERQAFLFRLNDAIGGSPSLDERIREDPSRAENVLLRRLRFRTAEARNSREGRRTQQAALESIIRKSADWGYEMGKSGAPRVVPDVEWGPNGEWRITTEVPQRKQTSVTPVRKPDAEHMRERRQIAELENEIREHEKNDTMHLHAREMGVVLPPKGYLRLLKERLRAIDPGNPWSLD